MIAQPLSENQEIVYPERDGNPIADNTLQFRWIVTIQGGLDAEFRERDAVFVVGDLLWYPVEKRPEIRAAPDVLVVFGRPKGDRGSYRQWAENDIAPQVVFEVLSPGNRTGEMLRKLNFYDRYGVDEYYLYDPEERELFVWRREALEEPLRAVDSSGGGEWTSPRLGIRLALTPGEDLRLYHADGRAFLTFVQLEAARAQAEAERDAALRRAARLAEQLRALGVNPQEGEE